VPWVRVFDSCDPTGQYVLSGDRPVSVRPDHDGRTHYDHNRSVQSHLSDANGAGGRVR